MQELPQGHAVFPAKVITVFQFFMKVKNKEPDSGILFFFVICETII
jgi:hypothetical protein